MENLTSPLLLSVLVLGGVLFLAFGISTARKILTLIKEKQRWRILIGFLIFFIVGYLLFLIGINLNFEINLDFIVALIFLFGAVFVFIVMRVSYDTVEDILRIDKLEMLAITDPLTGLYNRRYIEARAESEIKRAARYGHHLSALLLDIDHFKKINDSYGHQFGDKVLIKFSEILKAHSRDSDIVARYGGEEFLLIFPETSLSAAEKAAERFRELVQTIRIPLSSEEIVGKEPPDIVPESISITVSIGISGCIKGDTATCERIIQEADKALYQAKQEGRNKTVTFVR